jgi:putative ABC transport system permease protein
MKRQDLLELAARNLREAMLRNTLTTLGVAVGVASLVAMLSLGVGLQELAGARLSRSGLFDTVVVFSRRDFRGFSREERRATTTRDGRALDEAARSEMEKLPGVAEVYPEIRFQVEARHGDKSYFATVAGLPPSARSNDAFDDMKGKYFSGPDAEEAVLLLDFARELGKDPELLLGQELTIRYAERQPMVQDQADGSAAPAGRSASSGEGQVRDTSTEETAGFSVVRRQKKLRIVGVVESEPFGGMRNFARGRVFIPIALAEQLNTIQAGSLRDALNLSSSQRLYLSVIVRVASAAQVQQVQETIKKMGFTTWSVLDATKNMRRFFAVLDLFLGIFGSIALAVASLGIVNTLVMAVLERRREIGIMKAIGASDGDVKSLFFAEAAALGLVGGIAGVILGWLIGKGINFGTSIWLARQELPPETVLVAPWWLGLGAVAFSVLVSLVAGLYPAARAARLDPVQALRYE